MMLRIDRPEVGCLALLVLLVGCAFNFEITSQRTALENQILGTYASIDDQVPVKRSLNADVDKTDGAPAQKTASSPTERARLNQQFNKTDIEELKNDQVLGENNKGDLSLLPKNIGLVSKAEKQVLRLAEILVLEENRDRSLLMRARMEEQDLESNGWDMLKKAAVVELRQDLKDGQWYEDDQGAWKQKTGSKQ